MQDIRNAFEGEEYASQRENTSKTFQQQKQEILDRINEQAYQAGFVIQATPMGLLTIPLKKGKPMSDDEFVALEQKEKEQIIDKQRKLQEALEAALRRAKGLTGVKAGTCQEDRSFEERSVNARVDQRLKDMAEKMVEFEKKEDHPT